MKEEISFNDYDKVDIRIGTVVNLSKNEKARKPSLVLEVDFGDEIGMLTEISTLQDIELFCVKRRLKIKKKLEKFREKRKNDR